MFFTIAGGNKIDVQGRNLLTLLGSNDAKANPLARRYIGLEGMGVASARAGSAFEKTLELFNESMHLCLR